MNVVVSDTSAISNLLSIGRAEILHKVFGIVLIPPAVAFELSVSHEELKQNRFYFSETVKQKVLQMVGETDPSAGVFNIPMVCSQLEVVPPSNDVPPPLIAELVADAALSRVPTVTVSGHLFSYD